ncbi:MAG: M23 family metallopeptidase [Deferribacteraceae bacterium]|nr:M23 family metallopeptidase [Deferribacteraceae bacterium]
MLVGTAAAFYKLSAFKSTVEQTAVIPIHLTLEPHELKETAERIAILIDRLSGSETFLSEIFSDPSIYNRYSYLEFTSGITNSAVFFERLSNSSGNLSELASFKDTLATETAFREKKYKELIKYLDEQSVILAHTPSIWPTVSEKVTSKFGFRRSPFTGTPSFHEGVDLESKTGMPVKATADGIVVFAGVRSGYGFLVTIDHGFGYITRYAHNSKLLVHSGDIVKKGDTICLSGSTGRSAGPHLHYEVLYNGNPVNAVKYLPKK